MPRFKSILWKTFLHSLIIGIAVALPVSIIAAQMLKTPAGQDDMAEGLIMFFVIFASALVGNVIGCFFYLNRQIRLYAPQMKGKFNLSFILFSILYLVLAFISLFSPIALIHIILVPLLATMLFFRQVGKVSK